MKKNVYLLAALFWCAASIAEPQIDDGSLVNGLLGKNLEQRRSALHQIEQIVEPGRKDAVAASLVKLLERDDLDRSFEGTLHLAIDAIGALKAEKAIPSLIKHLRFVPDNYRVEELIPTEMYFPAASALVKIGNPAINPMIRLLENPEADDVSKKLAVWVIMEVRGKEHLLSLVKSSTKPMKFKSGLAIEEYVLGYKPTFKNPVDLPGWLQP